jgi:hypothetical protein
MMRSKILLGALLAGAAAFTYSVPATAAPLMTQSDMGKAAPSSIKTVQYYGHGHRHYGYGHHHHGGGGAGALIGGLAAGAIIGGAIAAGQANAAAAAQQNAAYCAQRFRSYDPASGTYLGLDGYRHPCP